MMHPDVLLNKSVTLTCEITNNNLLICTLNDIRIKFHPQGISMLNSTSQNETQCHAHIYVYENVTVIDQEENTNLGQYKRWVKKGRVMEKHYISATFQNKWIKVELTSNSHGRFISNGIAIEYVLPFGTPLEDKPSANLPVIAI